MEPVAPALMSTMHESGIEFRRGSAGGGNQLRQPYLKGVVPEGHYKQFPHTDHIHFYGFYIGNFPDLRDEEVDWLGRSVRKDPRSEPEDERGDRALAWPLGRNAEC